MLGRTQELLVGLGEMRDACGTGDSEQDWEGWEAWGAQGGVGVGEGLGALGSLDRLGG